MKRIPLKERLGNKEQPGDLRAFRRVCDLDVDDYFEALERVPGHEATGAFQIIHRQVIAPWQRQGRTLAELVARFALLPPETRMSYLYALLVFPILTLEEYL